MTDRKEAHTDTFEAELMLEKVRTLNRKIVTDKLLLANLEDRLRCAYKYDAADAAQKLESAKHTVTDHLNELTALGERVREAAGRMRDETNALMIVNYYINGLTWEKTAELMYYERESLSRRKKRAIEDFAQALGD